MRQKRCFLIALLVPLLLIITARSGFAQTQRDTLFLYNGEILIGELKQMIRGKATFDSKGIGVVTVKTYKIRSAHTTMSTLRVETTERVKIYGSLAPSGSRDTLLVTSSSGSTKLAIDQISAIVPFKNNFFSQLEGNVSAGLSFAHSSSIGQFNLNANVKHTARWLESQLTFSMLGSIDSTSTSLDQSNAQYSAYHYVGASSWFADAGVSHQRNKELSLAHRYQGLLGAGNKFLTEQTIDAYLLSGCVFNIERSIGGLTPPTGLQIEVPLILKLNFFKFQHPNMQITMTNSGYISLTQSGRYRYDGNISFAWELISDFDLTYNIYANYDSKPLNPGAAKADYGLVLGVSYKF